MKFVSTVWAHPPADEDWKLSAACRGEDPALWFPNEGGKRHYDREVRAATLVARTICMRCPVRQRCLQYSIDVDARFGMFGGMTEHERAKITGRVAR